MKALELAASLKAAWINGNLTYDIADDAAAELRRLASVESDCAQYLKEGETPSERIKRALGDADSLMNLYRDVMAERDALKAELERIKALEPVATVMAHPTPSVSYSIRAIHGIPHGTKLYALGSKT